MMRDVDWKQVVFVAAGVPALVLFSMGGISATVGAPAWLVWTISVLMGFAQAFTYAEIAGLHPSKTGGTAVHGATAWIRYSQILAPLSLWSNWLAWTPVLAIGSGLGAGYLLSIFYAPDASIMSWQVTLVDLGFISDGLSLRFNATFLLGAAIMLVVFAIQHRGILRRCRTRCRRHAHAFSLVTSQPCRVSFPRSNSRTTIGLPTLKSYRWSLRRPSGCSGGT